MGLAYIFSYLSQAKTVGSCKFPKRVPLLLVRPKFRAESLVACSFSLSAFKRSLLFKLSFINKIILFSFMLVHFLYIYIYFFRGLCMRIFLSIPFN